ncbi:MAG: putative metalloprotease CJM1_0395 family protein [Alphaproteobacteria bacterium]
MDAVFTELTGGQAARHATPSRTASAPIGESTPPTPEATVDAIRGDKISLSAAAEGALRRDAAGKDGETARSDDTDKEGQRGAAQKGVDGEPLSDDEQREVERLKARDQEVRTHEQAHQAAGGGHAGAPSYEYESGPDGKQYAVSGEVKIDVAAVPGNPQATIDKMETVKRAALAPAEPSGADRAVAAKADQAILKARQELREQAAPESGEAPAGPGSDATAAADSRTVEARPGAPLAGQVEPVVRAAAGGPERGSLLSLVA